MTNGIKLSCMSQSLRQNRKSVKPLVIIINLQNYQFKTFSFFLKLYNMYRNIFQFQYKIQFAETFD